MGSVTEPHYVVDADDMRDLERENARLNEERIEAQKLGMQAMDEAAALRADGRELKRLRKLFAAGATVDRGIGFRGVLAQNRIQKARKK
jgi:hypothetical protein